MSIQEATLDLENKGKVFVKGINNSEGTLDSNGSGKSATTSESLLWVLTGETNKDAKTINNRRIKGGVAKVTLDFKIDDNEFTITRINDTNKTLQIIKNGKDITGNTYTKSKDILDKELGFLNKTVLTSIIILGQGLEDRFSKLKPSERKGMLEGLVGMDSLLNSIGTILDNAEERINKGITESNLKITEQNAIINTSKQIIDNSKVSKVITEEEYQDNLNKYNELDGKIKELQSKLKNNEEDIKKKLVEKDEFNKKIIESTNNMNSKNSIILNYNNKYKNIENNIKSLQSQLDSAEKSECPLCHQHLSDDELKNHLKEEINKNNDELNKLTKEINVDNIKKEINDIQSTINEYNSSLNSIQDNINKINSNSNDINKELNEVNTNYSQYKTLIDEYNKYKAEENSLEQVKKEAKTKIDNANKELSIWNTSLQKYNKDRDISKFFRNNVSRKFRNFLLEGVFGYINERLIYYSSKLFDNYSVRLENNGNNIDIVIKTDGFDLDFKDLSGGEQRRVDMIIQCSLRDLARNQRGLSCNMLVLDEVFDYLDALGIETMVQFIEEEIKGVNTMFITTHQKDINIDFDSMIEVTKGVDKISTVKVY